MKNDLFKKYYSRFILNVVCASAVLFAITAFFIYNTMVIGDGSDNFNLYNIILFLLFGVIAFALTFVFLERKRVKYIDDIYQSIENISSGDYTSKLEVIGDDELSMMAFNINVMQDNFTKLIMSEKESENTKNELVTNIAHDLRTPLTSILGYLDIIVNNDKITDEKKKDYTIIVYEKAKKLESLIEDLFSFTKMNYGSGLVVKKEKIDLVELLNQLISEFYPLFENNGIECSLESNVDSMMMNLDPKLTVRLFENLINNAIKYGKDGKTIYIKVNKNVDTVDVSVINFGKLIPKKSLKNLFDKFYRVDDSRASETGGTGLGLAIAKSIVELHGGKINVKSDSDGTVFKVTFKIDG